MEYIAGSYSQFTLPPVFAWNFEASFETWDKRKPKHLRITKREHMRRNDAKPMFLFGHILLGITLGLLSSLCLLEAAMFVDALQNTRLKQNLCMT